MRRPGQRIKQAKDDTKFLKPKNGWERKQTHKIGEVNSDSSPDGPNIEKSVSNEKRKKGKRGESGSDLRDVDPNTSARNYNKKENAETLKHLLSKQDNASSQRDSEAMESSSMAKPQLKPIRLEKKMGVISTVHLKEIRELEIVIEPPRHG